MPVQHVKVLLAGINALAMGDKRTPLKYGSCGRASSLYFATLGGGGAKDGAGGGA